MERITGPSFARPTPAPPLPARALMSVSATLALQLTARGYTPEQIAALRRTDVVDVLWDLQAALTVLGVPTVREAIIAAQEFGLLT